MTDSGASYISSVLGLCKKSRSPGTLASAFSLIFSFLVYYFGNKTIYVFIFFVLLILGFWAISKIHKQNGIGDHQWIGIDEVVGMWLVNFFLFQFSFSFKEAAVLSLASFAIFRVIDIFKLIPPLRAVNENQNQNAWAVLFDDIIAGFYVYFLMLVVLGFYDFKFLYFSFLILLPPMIANMTPTLLKMKHWSAPINEPLFGKNKTWRGFLGAIVIGTLSYFLLVNFNIAPVPNDIAGNTGFIILVGFLFSFGAIGGDLLKSFFKRKAGIAPGEGWAPWDQIDYILGMMLLTYFFYQYTFSQAVFLLILGGVISALAHRIGYIIKINSAKQ